MAGAVAQPHETRGVPDVEYTSLRAIFPSRDRKTSTPSHSSLRPSSGCVALAVHSLTAKSSPHRAAARPSNRSVGQRSKIDAMCARTASAPSTRSPALWFCEDDLVGVHRRHRFDVLGVPSGVVAIDQRGDVHARIMPEGATKRVPRLVRVTARPHSCGFGVNVSRSALTRRISRLGSVPRSAAYGGGLQPHIRGREEAQRPVPRSGSAASFFGAAWFRSRSSSGVLSIAPAAHAQGTGQAGVDLHRHDGLPPHRGHQHRATDRAAALEAAGYRSTGRTANTGGAACNCDHRTRTRGSSRREPRALRRRCCSSTRRGRGPALIGPDRCRPPPSATRSSPTSRRAAASAPSTTRPTWAPARRRGTGGTARRTACRHDDARPRRGRSTNVATVQVADHNHLATRDLADTYEFGDEHYNYQRNVRGTIMCSRRSTSGPTTPARSTMGQDHPISWCKLYDGANVKDGTGTPKRYTDGRTWDTGDGPLRRQLHRERRRQQPRQARSSAASAGWPARASKTDCSGTVWSSFTARGPRLNINGADRGRRGAGRQGLLDRDRAQRRGYPASTTGYVKCTTPRARRTTTTIVASIPARSDYAASEDGVLGMSLEPGFDLTDPAKRDLYVYYSPRGPTSPTTGNAAVRRLQPDQPVHAHSDGTVRAAASPDPAHPFRARDPARAEGEDRRQPVGFPRRPREQRPRPRRRRRPGFDSDGNLVPRRGR